MTGTGQAMGTADYMAPEQAADSRTVDIRADLYSLGCTLYKLISGQAPFSGPAYPGTLEKMHAHVHQPVPPIGQRVPDVPPELAAIVDRIWPRIRATGLPPRRGSPGAGSVLYWCRPAGLVAACGSFAFVPSPSGRGSG